MDEWNTKQFQEAAAAELRRIGFVSNEHIFSPYGKTMTAGLEDLSRSMHARFPDIGELGSGSVDTPVGTVHFVYDTARIRKDEIADVVADWIKNEWENDAADLDDEDDEHQPAQASN